MSNFFFLDNYLTSNSALCSLVPLPVAIGTTANIANFIPYFKQVISISKSQNHGAKPPWT